MVGMSSLGWVARMERKVAHAWAEKRGIELRDKADFYALLLGFESIFVHEEDEVRFCREFTVLIQRTHDCARQAVATQTYTSSPRFVELVRDYPELADLPWDDRLHDDP
jgi:hypothetical protein